MGGQGDDGGVGDESVVEDDHGVAGQGLVGVDVVLVVVDQLQTLDGPRGRRAERGRVVFVVGDQLLVHRLRHPTNQRQQFNNKERQDVVTSSSPPLVGYCARCKFNSIPWSLRLRS